MTERTIQLIAIVCLAIAMAGGSAHLLELPNKLVLSQDDYLIVQQIYRGWALLGIAVVGALITAAALTWFQRGKGVSFNLSLLATVCIALSLVVFFLFTFPANQATQNWTVLPDHWQVLRKRWEYSHAVNAVLYYIAMASLVISIARAR
jgi:predicted PurR-regulated permease PerM